MSGYKNNWMTDYTNGWMTVLLEGLRKDYLIEWLYLLQRDNPQPFDSSNSGQSAPPGLGKEITERDLLWTPPPHCTGQVDQSDQSDTWQSFGFTPSCSEWVVGKKKLSLFLLLLSFINLFLQAVFFMFKTNDSYD